jgi:hypothetical protein
VYVLAGSREPEVTEASAWLYSTLGGHDLDPRVQGLLATTCLRITDQMGVANVLMVVDAARRRTGTTTEVTGLHDLNARLLTERFNR